jgi:hypothetical protein
MIGYAVLDHAVSLMVRSELLTADYHNILLPVLSTNASEASNEPLQVYDQKLSTYLQLQLWSSTWLN